MYSAKLRGNVFARDSSPCGAKGKSVEDVNESVTALTLYDVVIFIAQYRKIKTFLCHIFNIPS